MPDVKFSNLYPYTDFHELNLDWVIKEVKFWSERVGKSIQKIELTGTVGLVDTYTITYSDGTTSTFDVTNGNGIASVAKTGTAGLVDTYTITFQDGSTTTFEVHNGTASIDPTLTLSDYAADAKVTGDTIDRSIALAKSGIDAVAHEIEIEHQETVVANTDGHTYMFPSPIPSGSVITVYNLSSTAAYNFRGLKMDGTEDMIIPSLGYGLSTTITTTDDYYGVVSYVGVGTDWHFKITFGNTAADTLVFYSIDQSSDKTAAEKSTARKNINAANRDDVVISEFRDLYGPAQLSDGYIQWSDGSTAALANAKYSDYIDVEEGDVITYALTVVGGVGAVIACYDNSNNYIQAASIQGIGNGSWNNNTGTLTIPAGVSYIRFATNSSYLNSDSINRTRWVPVKNYVDHEANVWSAKMWAAFGTSITDTSYIDVHFLQPTGKYVPFLAEMSGLQVTNFGIAGASFLSDIMNRVLSTDLTGYDLVTIEGAVNDFATSKPIGNVGDTVNTTFAGSIYQMANYVYQNSDATLIFITDHVGRYVHINPAPDGSDFYGDCAPTKLNNDNLLQIDYINMIIKQCEYFGIPCIMAGQKSGINLMTGDLYLMDHIHQTYAGGKQYAQTIWSELKNIRPRIITV